MEAAPTRTPGCGFFFIARRHHGYTMGIYERLAREKQERAVRVERALEGVCRSMINTRVAKLSTSTARSDVLRLFRGLDHGRAEAVVA